MKYEDLKICVESLHAIRSQFPNALDAGTEAELDDVIQRLEQGLTNWECAEKDITVIQDVEATLALLARIIELYTNVSDLVSRFWN